MTIRKRMPTTEERIAKLELAYAQLLLKYTELDALAKESYRRTRVLFAKHFGLVEELNGELSTRKQLKKTDNPILEYQQKLDLIKEILQ